MTEWDKAHRAHDGNPHGRWRFRGSSGLPADRHRPDFYQGASMNHLAHSEVLEEEGGSEVEGETGAEDCCVYWSDEFGGRWCKDVVGSYGEPGAVYCVDGESWHIVHIPEVERGIEDGCIYWREEDGRFWCRDVLGHYGPEGLDYQSQDGETWFGEADSWLELADEAAELFARSSIRKELQTVTSQRDLSYAGRPKGVSVAQGWNNPKGKLKSRNFSKDQCDGFQADGTVPKNDLQEDADKDLNEGSASKIALFGKTLPQILAIEAKLDSHFDSLCRDHAPIVWPEMPLRL
mmetsp:Transcript_39096/g.60907  ORF Transcript_39096/g.60907 Transcript_39096/m.60907 type:complete len:291 (-) Transcript_39096:933-1805(-)|eukprot:CAMPEP_0184308118 /NCGR_PEP_ID=MMETSP1049-20130417/16661_1 /TAXON_ID=77928 /ORGANISM="Proteomonas sulcata, Strain CCMP704" /LENGTH=290 /DNA_ID=CAMNT_0026620743 /DNA_START=180 /DNA_END=1052 /DNA_ORIENTATION=-